jgi:hypothetical protein
MFAQLLRRAPSVIRSNSNGLGRIHTTAVNSTFWEREKKSGYGKKYPSIPTKAMVLDGLQELKSEIKMWRDEVQEKFEADPIMVFRAGEVDIAWKFSGLLRDKFKAQFSFHDNFFVLRSS